ncbi:TAT leader-containing periplasmic protein [Shewanella colwelliana]|uniref:TAT leader-containing periplasmic protein n=1 Tax=Shewanella colwelliana TaxID=23 RepID=UPI003D07567F
MKRRTFLTTALVGTGALALGVNLYSPSHVKISEALDEQHRLLFSLLIPVFLDGALPEIESQRIVAQNQTIEAIVATMGLLPDDSRAELEELLELLESRLGLLLLTGSMTPLLMRRPAELVDMLERWRASYLDIMITAYQGLRELVIASYYSSPEHWTRLNYNKPTFLN